MNRYLAVALFGTVLAQNEECTYSLEVLQVQDGSGSFYNYVDLMAATTEKLVVRLADKFGEFKYGISSFIDKPMPTRGLGYYGNYATTGLPPDYCFTNHAIMTDDVEMIRGGLEELKWNMGSGGDFPENPYEALILAAYNERVGWSSTNTTHSPSGRPIARLALIVTDDIPHYKGDAYNGATLGWSAPRSYANPDRSTGGFGSIDWGTRGNMMFYSSDGEKLEYVEMCNLFKIVDLGGVLTAAEETRLDVLITKFGPYPWPEIEEHPGDDSGDCGVTEYPSFEQIAKALDDFKITPIILLAEPTTWSSPTRKKCESIGMTPNLDCLVEVYTRDLTEMGVDAVIASITSDTVIDVIVEAIGVAKDQMCIPPTEEPTEAPTVTEETEVTTVTDKTDKTTVTDKTEVTSVSDKTEVPSVSDKTEVPSVSDETVVSDETEVPAVTDETEVPSVSDETEVPAVTDETEVPAVTDQTEVPAVTDQTEVPAVTDETQVTTVTDETQVTTESEEHSWTAETDETEVTAVSEETEVPSVTDETERSEIVTTVTRKQVSTRPTRVTTLPTLPTWPSRSTKPSRRSTTTTTTTPSSGGVNIGLIAGATGGAVAAVAGLAALAYKKFGMSLFGNGAAAEMANIQQVETPDSPVERETMGEVTMDMFQ